MMTSQPADPSALSQKGSVYFYELAVAADQEKQQVLRLRYAPLRMTVLYEESMTQESRSCLPTAMPMRNFDGSFGGRWERRQPGHGEQKLVRGIVEVQVGIDSTVGGG
jgi:hypothetical protein